MLQPTSVFGTNWNRIVVIVGTRFHLASCFTRRFEAPQAGAKRHQHNLIMPEICGMVGARSLYDEVYGL